MRGEEKEVSGFGFQEVVLSGVGNSRGASFSGKSISVWGLFPAQVEVWKDGHVYCCGLELCQANWKKDN